MAPTGDGYPLIALLAVRRREEEDRQRALAMALEAVSDGERRLAAADARAHAARTRRETAMHEAAERAADGSSAGEMTRSRQYEERLRLAERDAEADLVAARASLSAARETAEHARSALAQAAGDRAAIERHEGRWREGRLRERERRAEAEADDRSRKDPC